MKENKEKSNSTFECTICLETAKEPVVTKCGHLFCWPCIFNWMQAKGNETKCPNCKNPISKDDLIPVYTKDQDSNNTNRFDIPKRPKGERNESSNSSNSNSQWGGPNFTFGGAFGFFPFFGFNLTWNNNQSNNSSNSFSNSPRGENINQGQSNIKMALTQLLALLFMIYVYYIIKSEE